MSLAASILLKVTITTGLALVVVRLAHKSRASVRHMLLAAAFAMLVVLPLGSLVAPAVRVAVPSAVQGAIDSLDVTTDGIDRQANVSGATRTGAPSSSHAGQWLPSYPVILAGLWLAGAVASGLPILLGLLQVRSIRTSAQAWPEGETTIAAIAAGAGIRRSVAVVVHESVPGPMTCGWLRPAIVLPLDARTWTTEDLQRAVVHELEHVRRGDWISQILARAVVAVYWFHPIVWSAWRQLALEAERACDDAVLRRSEATAYADQLVSLAQRLAGMRQRAALGMANRADLAARVGAVLNHQQRRGPARASWIALACATSALLVMTMSPLRIAASTQTPAAQLQAAAGGSKRYDAATVKPCPPDDQIPGPARGTAGGTNASASPGRFNVPCVTAEQLVYLAYASYGARADEHLVNDDFGTGSDDKKVRGGPSWVHSYRDKWTIEATAAGVTDRFVLMGDMLRTLLEERFKLKLHRDQEDVDMFAMVVAKSGFKLKPMKPGDCETDRSLAMDTSSAKPPCGNLMMNGGPGRGRWAFAAGKMPGLAYQLSRLLQRHVIDRTGITDEFMMTIEFRVDDDTPGMRRPADPGVTVDAPSIFTALEQQVGVKLETTRGPRQFIVIDRIEKPSPDGR